MANGLVDIHDYAPTTISGTMPSLRSSQQHVFHTLKFQLDQLTNFNSFIKDRKRTLSCAREEGISY